MIALLTWMTLAWGGELAGVTLPDTATVGGQPVVLNGLGLREKFFFDIYVGGLYLPAKTTDAKSAIEQDVPKRLQMHFVYGSGVTKDQVVSTFTENLDKQPGKAAVEERFKTLYDNVGDLAAGDELTFDYVPGTGTTVIYKGKTKVTIPGKDFMLSLFTVYLGDSPPTAALKNGLMGK